MIESTDAIVLRAIKYGDTSKIVTLYTRRFGKVAVIAKGARSAKSKFGSALEPMSLIQAVFYRKENREVQLLSQADLLHPQSWPLGRLMWLTIAALALMFGSFVVLAQWGGEPKNSTSARRLSRNFSTRERTASSRK